MLGAPPSHGGTLSCRSFVNVPQTRYNSVPNAFSSIHFCRIRQLTRASRLLSIRPIALPPHAEVAAVTFDGEVVDGTVPQALLRQVRQFLALNRETLLAYWNYEILTDELQRRLRSIA